MCVCASVLEVAVGGAEGRGEAVEMAKSREDFHVCLKRTVHIRCPEALITSSFPFPHTLNMSQFTLSSQAQRVVVLHAGSHPAHAVTGLLLGSSSTGTITRALPLTHNWSDLAPITEVACALAQAHAKTQGVEILGIYSAGERVNEGSNVDAKTERLARVVATKTGKEAGVIVVSGQRSGRDEGLQDGCVTRRRFLGSCKALALSPWKQWLWGIER